MTVSHDDVDIARDRVLVERAQRGELAAFADLYDRYFSRLVRFCSKRLGDPLEAEDAAQEAFVRAFRSLRTLGGERRFYPWLTRIASNACADRHRQRLRVHVGELAERAFIDRGFEGPEIEVDRAQLRLALCRLNDRHREVLILREQHEWSYQEIADHYQVTLGTVEAVLHRARRALRREYETITTYEVRSTPPLAV